MDNEMQTLTTNQTHKTHIRWMHWYPFGHDQNGWDAFLRHSIKDFKCSRYHAYIIYIYIYV